MNDPMHDNDDVLAGSLGRLPRELAPPGALEERTVDSLRNSGLLYSRSRSGLTLASWVLAASIGAIAFVGGSVISKGEVTLAPVDTTFALTLIGGQIDDSAAQVNRAAEFAAWATAARAVPEARAAQATGGEGSVPSSPAVINGDSVIVDEITSQAPPVAERYYVTAPSRDSASKIAQNCPHLKYGGKVIIQKVGAKTR